MCLVCTLAASMISTGTVCRNPFNFMEASFEECKMFVFKSSVSECFHKVPSSNTTFWILLENRMHSRCFLSSCEGI